MKIVSDLLQLKFVLLCGGLLTLGAVARGSPAVTAQDPVALPDLVTEDVTRAMLLLSSPAPERRIEALQRLANLKWWPAEDAVLRLLDDPAASVRRETVLALGRLGTGRSVPHLIRLLADPAWEIRQNAWLELGSLTAQSFAADQRRAWETWWDEGNEPALASALLASLRAGAAAPPRRPALRALRHLATSALESNLLEYVSTPLQPPLTPEEWTFVADTLDRIGTARSIPVLARMPGDAAAWALGRLGGPEAEQALLRRPRTLAVWLNLDRLHSTRCGPEIPSLIANMGLITYRGQPDDLTNPEPQPIQRAAAHLILRSGQAPLLVELLLRELEATMRPPLTNPPGPAIPPAWTAMLQQMREELKPGFVRGDGVTTSQPLVALSLVATNRALTPRLLLLLRHPAFVPRVYVALLLGRLHATEALPDLLRLVREGYPFSDATALASGKHFDQSQTVRWRGFLCFALGRLGGEEARRALEGFAADPLQPRDVRYGAVIGLRFLASPQSLPVLRQVAERDLIWMVRAEAQDAVTDLQILSQEQPR